MNRSNLAMIKQPSWKVLVIDAVARVLGILVKVEGIPVGSNRNYLRIMQTETVREGSILGAQSNIK